MSLKAWLRSSQGIKVSAGRSSKPQQIHGSWHGCKPTKERVVLTNFVYLNCTQNCYKSLGKVSKTCTNHSSRKRPFYLAYYSVYLLECHCGVGSRNSECLLMLKWSHTTDITNMGQIKSIYSWSN